MNCQVKWLVTVLTVSCCVGSHAHGAFVTDGLEVYYDTRDMTILGVERGDEFALKDRAGDDNDLVLDGFAAFSSASPAAGNMYMEGGQSGALNPGTADVLENGGGVSDLGVNGPDDDPNAGLTGLTIEMLIRKPIVNGGDVFTDAKGTKEGEPDPPGRRLWSLEESFSGTGRLRWVVNDGEWHFAESPGLMPNNQWYHFVGVWGDRDGDGVQTAGYDETLSRMFLNGVQVDTGLGPTDMLNAGAVGRPGVFVGAATASGQLGFFRLYTRALDPGEVNQNWEDARSFFSSTPTIPGDFDFDGSVTGNDFLYWQRNSEIGDLADWEGNYGSVLSSIASVPEPSALFLMSFSLIALSFHRNKRQQWGA